MTTPNTSIVRILNVFDPSQRRFEDGTWAEGKTIAEVLQLSTYDHVVSINGRIFDTPEYETTRLLPGNCMVLCPIPAGGGDSKNILRIAALVAIAIAAPYIGGWAVGGAWGSIATTAGGFAVAAGVSIAGSMLVNALLPVRPPSVSGREDLSDSQSYGVDGALNTSDEGTVVPICYGEFRMAGNLINSYIENAGDTQRLYLLFNAGEGPIAGIDDIEINDQPIANFENVEYEVRTGTADQPILPWFNETVVPRALNQKLITTSYSTFTTVTPVDKLRIDVTCPQGLYGVVSSDGSSRSLNVDISIEYRLVGAGSWTTLAQTNEIVSYTEVLDPIVRSGIQYGTGTPYSYTTYRKRQVPVYGSVTRVSDKSKAAVRRSFGTTQLVQGIYEVRVKRLNTNAVVAPYAAIVDDIYVTDINEIVVDKVNYTNTALLALKITLNEQINSLPRVNFLNEGMIVQVWNESTGQFVGAASQNPAWIALDALCNTRYGARVPFSRIKFDQWKKWAKFCDDNNFTFNGIIDTRLSVWDALQYVMRAGRAQIINVGTRYGVAIESEDTPVQLFGVGNIAKGSFKVNWLPMAERANEMEVTFYDKLDKYKERTIRVYDPAALTSGATQRSASVSLVGVVDSERAYKEAVLHLNLNKYLQQTIEFDAPLEAIACTVGNLIYVQHDMPQWGYAGRLAAGSTTTVIYLDRPMTMEVAKTYKLLVTHDKVQRVTNTINSVVGNYVYLNGFNGTDPVKRLALGTQDKEVLSVVNNGAGLYGVEVGDLSGVTVGRTYVLWDTNVIEERDVVNSANTTSTLTLSSALSQAPAQYTNFMFGEVGKVKKPFRVRAITLGMTDYTRHITALEYNAAIYGGLGTAPVPNYSALSSVVPQSVIQGVTEELVPINSVYRSLTTIHFTNSYENYRHSEVFVSINGTPFESLGMNYDRASIEVDTGDVLIFKVVARDILNRIAPESAAPTSTYTVLGKNAPPSNVTGFLAQQSGFTVVLTWSQVTDIDLAGYEIRYLSYSEVPVWETAQILTSTTRGTQVTTARVPPGFWTFMIKAVDASGVQSTTAAIASSTVTSDQVIFRDYPVSPDWLNLNQLNDAMWTDDAALMWNPTTSVPMWTSGNFVKTFDGCLVPDSQVLADDGANSGWDTFDVFVPSPYPNCTYDTVEIDLYTEESARVFFVTEVVPGPGQSGTVTYATFLDEHQQGGLFDGFVDWTSGQVSSRYIAGRIQVDTTSCVPVVKLMTITADNPRQIQTGTDVYVPPGGLTITYAPPFKRVPAFTANALGAGLGVNHFSPSSTSILVKVYQNGVDVGGFINYTATGV